MEVLTSPLNAMGMDGSLQSYSKVKHSPNSVSHEENAHLCIYDSDTVPLLFSCILGHGKATLPIKLQCMHPQNTSFECLKESSILMVVIKKQLINKSTNKQVSLQKQEADSFARSPNMRSDMTHCVKTHHGMGTGVLKLPTKKKLSSWSR